MHAIAYGEILNSSAHKYIPLVLILLTLAMGTHSPFLVKINSSKQAENNLKLLMFRNHNKG